MTKEELRKEAEAFTDSKNSFWRQGRTCVDSVKQAYIAGAESREKRIEELEATNKTISNECHKLVDSLEKKQKEVVELQHLIKTQDRKLRQQSKVCDEAIDRVETLVKENAELKERNRELLESCEGATMMYKDLCKAKEIIKKLINACCSYGATGRATAEAEQFLKTHINGALNEVTEE